MNGQSRDLKMLIEHEIKESSILDLVVERGQVKRLVGKHSVD